MRSDAMIDMIDNRHVPQFMSRVRRMLACVTFEAFGKNARGGCRLLNRSSTTPQTNQVRIQLLLIALQ